MQRDLITPEEHIVQAARYWRKTEQDLISATGEQKERARDVHRDARKKLRETITFADRRVNP